MIKRTLGLDVKGRPIHEDDSVHSLAIGPAIVLSGQFIVRGRPFLRVYSLHFGNEYKVEPRQCQVFVPTQVVMSASELMRVLVEGPPGD